jgi:hypothetical protein
MANEYFWPISFTLTDTCWLGKEKIGQRAGRPDGITSKSLYGNTADICLKEIL